MSFLLRTLQETEWIFTQAMGIARGNRKDHVYTGCTPGPVIEASVQHRVTGDSVHMVWGVLLSLSMKVS